MYHVNMVLTVNLYEIFISTGTPDAFIIDIYQAIHKGTNRQTIIKNKNQTHLIGDIGIQLVHPLGNASKNINAIRSNALYTWPTETRPEHKKRDSIIRRLKNIVDYKLDTIKNHNEKTWRKESYLCVYKILDRKNVLLKKKEYIRHYCLRPINKKKCSIYA